MRTFLSLLLLTFTVSVSGAVDKEFELKPLVPESEHTDLYIEVLERLATQHYRTKKIDDDLSSEYLSSYIERLDPVKRYFLASDIKEFNQWQTKLDDFARRGDVRVGFYIFNRLRERAVSRLQSNIALLEDSEFNFDFSSDETIMLDPDERDWFDSIEAADKFSINALKDSMIRLILSGKEESEARELLVKRYRAQLT